MRGYLTSRIDSRGSSPLAEGAGPAGIASGVLLVTGQKDHITLADVRAAGAGSPVQEDSPEAGDSS